MQPIATTLCCYGTGRYCCRCFHSVGDDCPTAALSIDFAHPAASISRNRSRHSEKQNARLGAYPL